MGLLTLAAIVGAIFAMPIVTIFRDDPRCDRHWYHSVTGTVPVTAVHAFVGVWEHAVPKYWQKRTGYLPGQ